jgi:hypothetical protein
MKQLAQVRKKRRKKRSIKNQLAQVRKKRRKKRSMKSQLRKKRRKEYLYSLKEKVLQLNGMKKVPTFPCGTTKEHLPKEELNKQLGKTTKEHLPKEEQLRKQLRKTTKEHLPKREQLRNGRKTTKEHLPKRDQRLDSCSLNSDKRTD